MNNTIDLEAFFAESSTKVRRLVESARCRGCEVEIFSVKPPLCRVSCAGEFLTIFKNHIPFNTKSAVLLAGNKHLTKRILEHDGISVPKGFTANTVEEGIKKAGGLDCPYPLVVKPIDGSCGIGITVGINNEKELEGAIHAVMQAQESSKMLKEESYIVEEMITGKDYRILVLDKKVLACVERIPASVTGNGRDSVSLLINRFNEKRSGAFCIKMDESGFTLLHEQGLGLADIPKVGQKVSLRKNANISTGGTPIDRTEAISNRFKKIAISATQSIGLRFAGIDLYTNNISSEDPTQEYAIIEVNGNLIDYDIHEKPIVSGAGVDITNILLDTILPSSKNQQGVN